MEELEMDKTEFLKELSKMSRDDIRKKLESSSHTKRKKIAPVLIVRKYEKKKKGEKINCKE